MTETDRLVTFITAQLDEREAKARAATEGPWTVPPKYPGDSDVVLVGAPLSDGRLNFVVYPDIDYGPLLAPADAKHMIANDPPSVLRDVEATRRLVGLAEEEDIMDPNVGELILRAIATRWPDAPGYDPTWSPA